MKWGIIHWLLAVLTGILLGSSWWACAPRTPPPALTPALRQPVTLAELYRRMHLALEDVYAPDRPYQRLLTLHHWHNSLAVPDDDLAECWCALTRWAERQAPGRSAKWRKLHPAARLIDLRSVGIADGDEWTARWQAYPYGWCLDTHAERAIRRWAEQVRRHTQCEQPVLRADWLTVTVAADAAPRVWQRYHAALDWADVAHELGWTEARAAWPIVLALPELRALHGLPTGQLLARRQWADTTTGFSLAQRAAGELGIGTPVRSE
jgi:hypothetical protein